MTVEDWAEIRRLHRSEEMPIKAIVRQLGVSRNAVRRALAGGAPPRGARARGGGGGEGARAAARGVGERGAWGGGGGRAAEVCPGAEGVGGGRGRAADPGVA